MCRVNVLYLHSAIFTASYDYDRSDISMRVEKKIGKTHGCYLFFFCEKRFPLGQGGDLQAVVGVLDQEVGHRGGPALTAQTVVGTLQGFDLHQWMDK